MQKLLAFLYFFLYTAGNMGLNREEESIQQQAVESQGSRDELAAYFQVQRRMTFASEESGQAPLAAFETKIRSVAAADHIRMYVSGEQDAGDLSLLVGIVDGTDQPDVTKPTVSFHNKQAALGFIDEVLTLYAAHEIQLRPIMKDSGMLPDGADHGFIIMPPQTPGVTARPLLLAVDGKVTPVSIAPLPLQQ